MWEKEIVSQAEHFIVHKAGDLLWRENTGWAICLEDADTRYARQIKVRLKGVEKNIAGGYYVNVSQLKDFPEVNVFITDIFKAVN